MNKNLVIAIVLGAVCVGLFVALFTTNKRADEQHREDTDKILGQSNRWFEADKQLTEQRTVNQNLEKVISEAHDQFSHLTNKFTELSGTLIRTEDSLRATQDEVAKRDQKIAALETQNRELDEKAIDLSAALTNLTTQIADTQRKLDASEGDKAFLEKELKRLMAEKAELERQFNDLAVLREQVSRLKAELSIARRLEWIRKGLFAGDEQKGAQKLIQLKDQTSPAPTNHYDLNVEVNADGSVRVIPPLTNAPAAK
jgi:chromosome segregation ATPase